mmetsp:Transcript_14095/g.29228  ORF Transcript_14095/g.29228 Transcript_14095/m.29228 type:complete len:210 (+) Transcript_14095:496-1125(+)
MIELTLVKEERANKVQHRSDFGTSRSLLLAFVLKGAKSAHKVLRRTVLLVFVLKKKQVGQGRNRVEIHFPRLGAMSRNLEVLSEMLGCSIIVVASIFCNGNVVVGCSDIFMIPSKKNGAQAQNFSKCLVESGANVTSGPADVAPVGKNRYILVLESSSGVNQLLSKEQSGFETNQRGSVITLCISNGGEVIVGLHSQLQKTDRRKRRVG